MATEYNTQKKSWRKFALTKLRAMFKVAFFRYVIQK